MRRICSSSSTSQSSALSARADSRSWPKGFSITTWAFSVRPASPRPVDDGGEQRGRDLQVEDRPLGLADRLADPLEGGRRRRSRPGRRRGARRAGRRRPRRDRSTVARDRLAGVLAQLLVVPLVDRDADDRAVELAPRLEPVERPEGHFLRQVAADPEDRQHVGGGVGVLGSRPSPSAAQAIAAVQAGHPAMRLAGSRRVRPWSWGWSGSAGWAPTWRGA